MAERLAPDDYDQLHHFIAAGVWDAAPLAHFVDRQTAMDFDRSVISGSG
jgi:hypothetical protein